MNRSRAALAGCLAAVLTLGIAASAEAKVVTKTFQKSGPVAIPDAGAGVVNSPLRIRPRGKIRNVIVHFRANHTYVGDLVVYLVSPRGQAIALITGAGDGSNDDNFGTGPNSCAGTPTTLTDSATTPISSAAALAPFAGLFRPLQALAALRGKRLKGVWRLLVADGANGDIGTLGCWKLRIKYKKVPDPRAIRKCKKIENPSKRRRCLKRAWRG